MIFDNQSAIVKGFRKFFVKGCILKHYLQNMWISIILDGFLKNSFQNFSFLAIFLEFFGLGNNHTIKDQNFQTKSHEFSLFICKNLNIFYIKSFANRLETCKSDLYKSDTCKRLATSSLAPILVSSLNSPVLNGVYVMIFKSLFCCYVKSSPNHKF